MIRIEDCVFCIHKTITDKSQLRNIKSYCEAFPEGTDGIPDWIIEKGGSNIAQCKSGFKFKPNEKDKHLFQK